MEENKRVHEVLREAATLVELLKRAQDSIGGTYRRVHDPAAYKECETAGHYLYSARQRIRSDIPEEYRVDALMRLMFEDIRTWGNKIEESLTHDGDEKVSLARLLPKDFLDRFLDLARDAEHLVHSSKV